MVYKSKLRRPFRRKDEETPSPPIGHNSKWLNLPPDFNPIDATIDEVASWRRESRWTVHKKIREGAYQSYRDGRIRKIVFASVMADRERAMSAALTGKRRPGRPPKPPPESHRSPVVADACPPVAGSRHGR